MPDLDPILQADELLRRDAPAVWAALSPLGRRLRQPANFLPLQSAEARGKPFNATIGQITDGHGRAVPLLAMAAAVGELGAGLSEAELSQAFLYSPVEGLAELRRTFRDWQRRGIPEDLPSALPIVTNGGAQARGLALQLFVAEGGTVVAVGGSGEAALSDLVEMRLGGKLVEVGAEASAAASALDALPEGEPAVVLQLPGEKEGRPNDLAEILLSAAARRPLVAVIDDTWSALETPSASLFWQLAGRSPNLLALKVEGTEGTWDEPGLALGFLTLPRPPESPLARALESKLKMLLRAEVGSPSSLSQILFLKRLSAASPRAAPAGRSTRPGT
jgi:hypothetical protein